MTRDGFFSTNISATAAISWSQFSEDFFGTQAYSHVVWRGATEFF